MIPESVQRLDPSDATERARYERAFYAAFRRTSANRLVRSLWLWDDERERLAVRVPYEDQRIYVQRADSGDVNAGLAFNLLLRSFQSAAYGFAPPEPLAGCGEFLTFFSVKPLCLASLLRLCAGVFEDLRRGGFHTSYGTTAPRVMPLYRRLGAEVLATREINGEFRHFFRLPL